MVWPYPTKYVIVTMQMVAITLTRNDWFDDFFMAEFFTYRESKSTELQIFQKMQSPVSMNLPLNNGFLSLIDYGYSGLSVYHKM